MNVNKSENIKRNKDGSIDYNYYSLEGQSARNKEIKVIFTVFLNSVKRIKEFNKITKKPIKKTKQESSFFFKTVSN